MSGALLAQFALCGNAKGVTNLLRLGIDVDTPYSAGDPYYEIPAGSLPIHVACWLGRPGVVRVLIEHGAHIDAVDAKGQTPLALAIRACTHSYWTERRSPESVEALIHAGAN